MAEEPLEVHWMRLPATEKIAFDHELSRLTGCLRDRGDRPDGGCLEDPALRFALTARPPASQGYAAAGALQKMGEATLGKDPASN